MFILFCTFAVTKEQRSMIQEMQTYLTAIRGYSWNTAVAYGKDCVDFARWYREYKQNARWSTVTRDDIDAYMIHLSNNRLKGNTINRHIAALSMMFRYQQRQGLREDNPTKYESRKKFEQHMPQTISPQELKEAIENADALTATAMRTMLATGIRLQELLDMTVEDIDFAMLRIKVHGKGAKERYAYMDSTTAEMLSTWTKDKTWRVFPDVTPREMRWYVHDALEPYTRAQQKSPHAIRHTFATEMAKAGTPTTTLAVLMGHNSVKTTQTYVNMATNQVAEHYNKFNPFKN